MSCWLPGEGSIFQLFSNWENLSNFSDSLKSNYISQGISIFKYLIMSYYSSSLILLRSCSLCSFLFALDKPVAILYYLKITLQLFLLANLYNLGLRHICSLCFQKFRSKDWLIIWNIPWIIIIWCRNVIVNKFGFLKSTWLNYKKSSSIALCQTL